jgi:hypothetical protein
MTRTDRTKFLPRRRRPSLLLLLLLLLLQYYYEVILRSYQLSIDRRKKERRE